MPKNTIGGKHKHLKKNPVIVKKFELLDLDDDIAYAYITKAYGNRTFDAIILKSYKLIRFQAQYKRRKARVAVGSLIRTSLIKDFTKETYVVEDICSPEEVKAVQKDEDYEQNYRKILCDHDVTYRAGNTDSFIEFDQDHYQDEEDNVKRPSISYSEAVVISDDDSDASCDIDDL
jgi:hypothetical protein